MTAPLAGYGEEPAWIARVEKPRRCHSAGAPAPTPACSSRFGACGSAGGVEEVTNDHRTPRAPGSSEGAARRDSEPSFPHSSQGRRGLLLQADDCGDVLAAGTDEYLTEGEATVV